MTKLSARASLSTLLICMRELPDRLCTRSNHAENTQPRRLGYANHRYFNGECELFETIGQGTRGMGKDRALWV